MSPDRAGLYRYDWLRFRAGLAASPGEVIVQGNCVHVAGPFTDLERAVRSFPRAERQLWGVRPSEADISRIDGPTIAQFPLTLAVMPRHRVVEMGAKGPQIVRLARLPER